MKKLLLGVAPLLAVIAFAAMPALAQAETKAYGICEAEKGHAKEGPCAVEEKFKAFTEFKHEEVRNKKVSTLFVLESASKAGIECKSYKSIGYNWNVGGVGMSEESLNYDECVPNATLKLKCEAVNAKNNHEIQGSVTNEVTKETTVKVTISEGFNVKCLEKGTEVELGNVTGAVTGTQTGAVLKFAKATGLTFAGEASTITGESETETIEGKKKVFIN
jgi:hypothetical protein